MVARRTDHVIRESYLLDLWEKKCWRLIQLPVATIWCLDWLCCAVDEWTWVHLGDSRLNLACGLHVACQLLFCCRKISSPSTQVNAQTPYLPQWVTEYPPTSQLHLFALLEMKVSLHFKLQEFLQLLSLTCLYILTDDFVSFHPRQNILLTLIPVSFSLDSMSSIFLLDSCPF